MSTAFLFPGQGAHYAGVLGGLQASHAVVRQVTGEVEQVARARLGKSLQRVLWQEPRSTQQLLDDDPDLLQLVLFAVPVAVHALLVAGGVQPQVLMGHSFGEIAALTCAGAFTPGEGAQVVCERIGALAANSGPRSGMLAVAASRARVQQCLQAWSARRPPRTGPGASVAPVRVAVVNHAQQVVVSGEATELDLFAAHCAMQGLQARALQSPHGFHHPALARAAHDFAERLSAFQPRPLRLPVYSPILGRAYRSGDDLGECLAHHLTMPVDFEAGVQALLAQQVSTFVECGALDALGKSVIRVAGPGRAKVFAVLKQRVDEPAGVDRVFQHFQPQRMTTHTTAPESDLLTAFEAFWRERGPAVAGQIKSEFLSFIQLQRHAAVVSTPAAPAPAPAAVPVAPAVTVPAAALPRAELFAQLVAIYAQAMEYPPEVFTEGVELESELGIDSVKQTEIIQRISAQYRLPPLPANFRAGDIKTMGQIVDFVHANVGRPALAAA
ncbi:MAG: acyltransferase domain-containing protein [Aquincola tertiaricarbonis]